MDSLPQRILNRVPEHAGACDVQQNGRMIAGVSCLLDRMKSEDILELGPVCYIAATWRVCMSRTFLSPISSFIDNFQVF